ncbi:ricin B-like lectin R40G3 [Telopea speciosissima]|uniref:ricin B-like lectin R40G3 n=1 Tax=Telopea speciosissima TaxID=54955 RepID=UPI001CC598F1|nr:ricin B-like lectin R40G3 [Telopea speciosissima]
MEFPFGHHHDHNHHHKRRDEEEQHYPPPSNHEPTWPPPPQDFQPPTYPPPNRFDSESDYPSVHHVSHHHYEPKPEPQPDYASVHHVSHQIHQGFDPVPYDEFRSETHHQYNHHNHGGSGSELLNKPTSRVYSKAEPGYSLTVRDGHVILARSNENDPFQHWIKDEKYSTRVKDQEGFPSFSLVNKATGQAMKHSIGATHPVQLISYNPDVLDESVLWTESKDLGDGFRTIRMVNNIRLNLDAFHGDQNHGGVHDGTTIVLWEWKKGDNQRWKISPH